MIPWEILLILLLGIAGLAYMVGWIDGKNGTRWLRK